MTDDQITLTLPAERDFHRVAHLVLGGLAVRLNLTFEHLEDLQLALDGLLDHQSEEDDVTVCIRIREGAIETDVGPFRDDRVRTELERDSGNDVGLKRVLDTVVDRVEVTARDGGNWVRLTKHVEPRPKVESG
jgi:anti-sigma regulatory factor (Ser/Thr protein kinase)